jgi:hypothetical protein
VASRQLLQAVRLLVVLLVLQTLAEVLPSLAAGIPWTQPQAMKYGGIVFAAVLVAVVLRLLFRR